MTFADLVRAGVPLRAHVRRLRGWHDKTTPRARPSIRLMALDHAARLTPEERDTAARVWDGLRPEGLVIFTSDNPYT